LHAGHLGSFKSFNPTVADDAAIWFTKIKNRPVALTTEGVSK
jgi:hypothetical protein